ncbi:hypothetical protein SEA_EJIMIX_108 [Mycobacterium phage Ejimix]|uniref:Uncharacterized protein n=2 Tax=Omegavirus baka TaxID=1034099 RepID=A0A3S9UAY0_9CAUD|nr:hypothetical protein [Acinetobacter baumannii]YP_008410264.1 hypothetical protein N860_gp106 [Mycobacterium phage Redno2]YP_009636286.1 hypothetical protein FGG20_gp115 [Mycobacterium phage Baka]ATN88922.1 hypothetical protein SEA_DMPSTRDIVER_115 [Mycobacterium phage DmpstrDiver]AWH13927.1 hypothetical protein SEA_HALLEY_116 [Mycobacterium phage Halley]AXQ52109.1 hypothetical protein SEA_EJIMIX_108 [Mycobacterium phage Ejimix]AXQ52340.1 hypothetical protein SEA_ERICMILLARD_107 [Mycobacteri
MQTLKDIREYWDWWVVADAALALYWFVKFGFTLNFDHLLIGVLMLCLGASQIHMNVSNRYIELLEDRLEELESELE